MTTNRITACLTSALVILILLSDVAVFADPLNIYQIQYVESVDPIEDSPYAGQIVDCSGGIVTYIAAGSRPRLVVQDPSHPDGWGAIQVKGWSGEDTFAGINVGDWVSATNVFVEENRGTTFLQFGGDQLGPAPNATFTVESTGNLVPAPKVVALDQILAPVGGNVTEHGAECFESMRLTVEDVIVTGLGLGKADDNYVLHNDDGDAWASDYVNEDKGYFDLYHPHVQLGGQFASVTGVLEQYERSSSGWDYYQLLTTSTDDFQLVPEPSSWHALLAGMACLVAWMSVRRRRS